MMHQEPYFEFTNQKINPNNFTSVTSNLPNLENTALNNTFIPIVSPNAPPTQYNNYPVAYDIVPLSDSESDDIIIEGGMAKRRKPKKINPGPKTRPSKTKSRKKK